MSLTQKLELRQGQTLLMTPQLAQAIKLLQMPHYDLQAFVDAEVESNPLLEHGEIEDRSGSAQADEPVFDDGPREDVGAGGESASEDWFFSEQQPGSGDLEQTFDTTMDNVFPDDHGGHASGGGSPFTTGPGVGFADDDLPEIGETLSRDISLREHLLAQLDLASIDPVQRLIGHHLIDAIDGNGYLSVTLTDIAERLGISEAEVGLVLAMLQSFEPTGIGARDLAECLALQLKERNRFDPAMERLLSRLDLVAKRDVASLRKLCALDAEDIAEMLGEIRSLNPKPGSSFGADPVEVLLPDVLVRRGTDGGWQIELNPETLPRVLINQDYCATLTAREKRNPDAKGEDRSFLTECLARANWLTRSLEQRSRTILKVATEIVRQQEGFFLHGVSHLKPLTLRQVAEKVEMHESTISRVAAHKAFGTESGLFEMKFFFSAAIVQGDGGDSQAAQAVRERIRQLIDQEKPDDVLSDDALVQRLKQEKIDVARRTVAKYRESLKIPSSMDRRRLKKSLV